MASTGDDQPEGTPAVYIGSKRVTLEFVRDCPDLPEESFNSAGTVDYGSTDVQQSNRSYSLGGIASNISTS